MAQTLNSRDAPELLVRSMIYADELCNLLFCSLLHGNVRDV